jgi:hypothetical protein
MIWWPPIFDGTRAEAAALKKTAALAKKGGPWAALLICRSLLVEFAGLSERAQVVIGAGVAICAGT